VIGRIKRYFQHAPAADDAGGPGVTRVLMVCMGNICRSPTAEAVLRHKLQAAGLGRQVFVDSAGTHGFHAKEPPDPRAVAAAARRGYDLSALRARPVHVDDFQRFDWLLAMDEDNKGWLQRKAPSGHGARLELLLRYAQRHAGVAHVPDPYYGGPDGFDRVLDLVEDACDGFVEQLLAQARERKLD
jgi:protein-tyrosine phosphatase